MINVNEIKDYELINNDCFTVLKDIPDNSIDLILTDPPYNIAKYSTGNIKFDWRSDINNDLAEWENDIVLDCFNGVGSTGVAALKNNRRYLGIEIDKTYMTATEERLKPFRKK